MPLKHISNTDINWYYQTDYLEKAIISISNSSLGLGWHWTLDSKKKCSYIRVDIFWTDVIHTRNMLDRQIQSGCRVVRLHIQTEDISQQNSGILQREKHERRQWAESRRRDREGSVRLSSYFTNTSNVKLHYCVSHSRIWGKHSTRIRRSTEHTPNTDINAAKTRVDFLKIHFKAH